MASFSFRRTRAAGTTRRASSFPSVRRSAIRLFVMGRNQWRDEDEWPLARTQYVPCYLHSGGHANTFTGDGTLSLTPPRTEPVDQYDYDPQNPMPTRGGNHSIGPWNEAYKNLVWCGPCDQRPNEARPDMLVYTGEPLAADLEVTGPVTLKFWAASSARDTDFVARLGQGLGLIRPEPVAIHRHQSAGGPGAGDQLRGAATAHNEIMPGTAARALCAIIDATGQRQRQVCGGRCPIPLDNRLVGPGEKNYRSGPQRTGAVIRRERRVSVPVCWPGREPWPGLPVGRPVALAAPAASCWKTPAARFPADR